MDKRKEILLATIVERYSKTAEPVGSKFLAKINNLKLSPATIRNEMAELEEMGYITHPHTSAGRMPTEKGYQFYIENFIKNSQISKKDKDFLAGSFDGQNENVKFLAKALAELTGVAAMIGFSKNNFYYTGFSNLFSQPEFYNYQNVCEMSEAIDKVDEIINLIFDDIGGEIKIFMGKKNPFGDNCAALITNFENNKSSKGILGLLGPTRMNYEKNYGALRFSQELMNNIS